MPCPPFLHSHLTSHTHYRTTILPSFLPSFVQASRTRTSRRSTSPSSLSIPPYNNNNTSSGSAACCTTTASSTKKALYLLGTIILIMACIGPSGLLWDVFFDMDTSNDVYHHGSNHVSVHGDKHHNLPPPPPSYNVGSNNNNQMASSYHGMNIEHPMMVRREEGLATNSRHDKFGIKTEKRLEKTTAINRRKKNVSFLFCRLYVYECVFVCEC